MSDSTRSHHVLLAGGGTGGHVFPALAVADELRRRGHGVSFVGSPLGLEARLVPRHGVDFHALPALPVVGQGLVGRARAASTLLRSALRARALCRRLGVDAVLGTGGYVSAPAVIGARLAGRPVMLLEPNAHAGVANRQLSRWAAEAAVAYAETVGELSCPARVTGTPIRPDFFAVPALGAPAAGVRLLLLGGSQGSVQLNRTLPPALARLAAGEAPITGLSVLHQCGAAHREATEAAYAEAFAGVPQAARPEVEVTPFLDDVAGAMQASHLIVSRAGALTLAEICAAGRPAVLVPLAAALGHQGDNARALERAGAALCLDPVTLDAERLAAPLAELLADGARLVEMGEAARELARPGAAAEICDRLERLARGKAAA